ncbi:MAG: N-acyl-D-amino-acid deacylase family protein [Promethearchaeota archaeon]
MYDILIKNGIIIDGTGSSGFISDLAIKDGRIIKIEQNLNEFANHEIDASGQVVSPGFIDVHSHSDYIIPFYSGVDSSVFQGITTAIVGNCGKGLAPIDDEQRIQFKSMFQMINPEENLSWSTFSEYLKEMEKRPCPINTAYLIGMNNVVITGKGYENRTMQKKEYIKMVEIIENAMKSGAFGMSMGLLYPPHSYLSKEEIISLCKHLKPYDGIISAHIRCESETVIDAVKEFIDIVSKSNIRGQYSHAKVMGKPFWHFASKIIQLIESARAQGIQIYYDSYPYIRSGDQIEGYLPPWLFEKGPEQVIVQIQNPLIQKQIKDSIINGITGWENSIGFNGFENVYIMNPQSDRWKSYKGKSITEISSLSNIKDEWKTFFQIVIDEGLGLQVSCEDQSENNIRKFLINPFQMVGSDGVGAPLTEMQLHPRYYGTYPKLFGKYVREEKVLSIENAVRKCTALPAEHFHINKRGLLKSGNWADVVVFDPKIINEEASYYSKNQFPVGISHVIVNGIPTLLKGARTENYPGSVLRHKFS